ncbi:nucleotidyltransferase domain-containing protein [Pengzhenrongella sp.]|jgi:hypothetical protein|uniref:nucleotidyltransferase domain-containing protein n=1 Tax=Pengzhenrongella sp. TaxID=2888820 RepID=UPI002F942DA3
MTPAEIAVALVAARFPDAVAAFLGGSSATGARQTSTSDLDIVVVRGDGAAVFRETTTSQGWLVELFVHTPSSCRHYWDLDAAARRPPLLRMCAEGVQLVSVEGGAERVRTEARRRLAAGPPPVGEDEWAARRYGLSDLLDDLRGAARGPELVFIANEVLTATCEMALLAQGRWLGTGKWLARELERLDTGLLQELTSAHAAAVGGDGQALTCIVERVLGRVGGPLSTGYHVDGHLPQAVPAP